MKHKLNIINLINNKILLKIILSHQNVGPTCKKVLEVKTSGRPEKNPRRQNALSVQGLFSSE